MSIAIELQKARELWAEYGFPDYNACHRLAPIVLAREIAAGKPLRAFFYYERIAAIMQARSESSDSTN